MKYLSSYLAAFVGSGIVTTLVMAWAVHALPMQIYEESYPMYAYVMHLEETPSARGLGHRALPRRRSLPAPPPGAPARGAQHLGGALRRRVHLLGATGEVRVSGRRRGGRGA